MSPPLELDRFVDAQAPVFAGALGELQAGRKRSHWMWFIFPQLRGLGISSTAQHFGIAGMAEAKAYLAHGLLGHRLIVSTEAVLAIQGSTLTEIFGSPDDVKFVSSMTLFALASDDPDSIFRHAIQRHSGGHMDRYTLSLLGT